LTDDCCGITFVCVALELHTVGDVSESGYFRRAFLFERLALTAQHWTEHAADGDEVGVRVELQELREERGVSEFDAVELLVHRPIWRADLFRLSTADPGNFARAHFHDRFSGREPSHRRWDEELKAEPVGWLATQLGDPDALLESAGRADLAGTADSRRIVEAIPQVLADVRALLAAVPD
jgi:hypothetical protein